MFIFSVSTVACDLALFLCFVLNFYSDVVFIKHKTSKISASASAVRRHKRFLEVAQKLHLMTCLLMSYLILKMKRIKKPMCLWRTLQHDCVVHFERSFGS